MLALLLAAWSWSACDGDSPVSVDAMLEAGADAGAEAGADAGLEAGPDAGSDGLFDAGADVSVEGGVDADLEAGADADLGAPGDAATEAGTDATTGDGAVASGKPIWLVQLTDTHIGATKYASTVLAETIKQVIPTVAPAATVVTGDITEAGTAAQWTSYQAIVKGKVPAYPAYFEIPGNHDMKSSSGKEFLTGSQTGTASGGLYGMTYAKSAAGTVRVVRTNTADHSAATSRLLGFFSSAQKTKLLALPSTTKADHTVVAGHHPVMGLTGLQLLGTDKQMKELLTKVNAAVYLCGHVHSPHISWIKNTLVVQTTTLGKPSLFNPKPAYALVGLDATGPSVRLIPVGTTSTVKVTWPVVLVTAPAQADLGGKNPLAKAVAAGKVVTVRALAFSPKGVTTVQARVDSGAWSSMTTSGKPLWQGSMTAPTTTGKRTLEVRATSPEGTDTHTLKVLVGP